MASDLFATEVVHMDIPNIPKFAFSIDEFCRAHSLSRATLYNEWAAGRGPRKMKVGQRTLISLEAATDWRHDMEEGAGRQSPDDAA